MNDIPMICLHACIAGQPFPIRHPRRALAYVCRHREHIRLTTSGEIARHVADHAPIGPEAP